MSYRKFIPEQIEKQVDLVFLLRRFREVKVTHLQPLLEWEPSVRSLKEDLQEGPGKEFNEAVLFLVTAGFFLAKWVQGELAGTGEPERLLRSAKANAEQARTILCEMESGRPSVQEMTSLAAQIDAAVSSKDAMAVFKALSYLTLPLFFSDEQKIAPVSSVFPMVKPEVVERPVVLSVLFFFEKEMWANPQVIKPGHMYKIKGTLQVNYWPEGYAEMLLHPVTTTDDGWYTWSFPSIKPFQTEQEIEGTLVFHHAQAQFDTHWTIKLQAELKGPGKRALYPEIVGYDELKVKVLNEGAFPLLTRYPSLNERLTGLLAEIDAALPGLDSQEREDFAVLLSGILNYQGHCALRGTYRGVKNLSEDEFRDKMIDFLDADQRLTDPIVKEGSLAGGRVEINYKGIIAELKVERTESEREKIIEAHWRQPAAYATGAGKRLSVLCILDLTPKTDPAATPANNVFLREPQFHGFKETPPADSSRIAIVFIDGNAPTPSKLGPGKK